MVPDLSLIFAWSTLFLTFVRLVQCFHCFILHERENLHARFSLVSITRRLANVVQNFLTMRWKYGYSYFSTVSTFTCYCGFLPRSFVYLVPATHTPHSTPRFLLRRCHLFPPAYFLDNRHRPFLLVAVDNRYPTSCVFIITLMSQPVATPSSPEYPTVTKR